MMNYYLLLIALLFTLLALFLFWKGLKYFRRKQLYKRLKSTAWPKTYEKILKYIPQYKNLSTKNKEKIHLLILLFIDQKEFVFVRMSKSDEIKVIIAFYACLMRLGFDLGEKDNVRSIIVYPEHFIIHETHSSGGITHHETSILEGQSANGTVVLSWQDIQHDIAEKGNDNVTIHEFAHELDFEDGLADGTPVLENSRYKIWSEVFSKAFDTLKDQFNNGEVSERSVLLGSYALKNEAEFFAVCSERFFETPQAFKAYFPHIYQELKLFYKLDTQQLFKDL
jgi:Mlc titration factor MtfA (ptsG expression regulator)